MDGPNELPLYLYRYRSLDGASKARVRDSILNSKHYFSSPKAFNDPFDCKPVFQFNATKAEIIKYYEGVIARQAPHLSREQRRTEARSRMADPRIDPRNPKNLEGFYQIYDQAVTSRMGVLCLSACSNDILMWSHYANSHRGICLQFYAQDNAFETSQPVRYKEMRPVVNPVSQSNDEMLDHAIFTKADHWKYEQEWRFLQYKHGAGIYKTPPEALTGVILGAQILDECKRDILDWIGARSQPTKVYQAKVSPTSFSLEIDEIRT